MTFSRTSSITTTGSGQSSDESSLKRQKTAPPIFGGGLVSTTGSLSIALQKSTRSHLKNRTSFLGNSQSTVGFGGQDLGISSQKSISFSHVVFSACGDSQSQLSSRGASHSASQKKFASGLSKTKVGSRTVSRKAGSLWSKVMTTGPKRKR